ncbi:MAG: hypothetical protein PHQ20_00080 [Candidatus Moranbacteria bacterium]|nr:hypothetical protein [Candidatus Moranbacteria bacterium]
MTYFLMALVCSLIGVVPLALKKRVAAVAGLGGLSALVLWFLFWLTSASIVGPFFGPCVWVVLVLWIIAAVIDGLSEDDITWVAIFPIVLFLLFVIIAPFGGVMLRSQEFASIVGPMEEKVWTQDVQPKDPRHIRLANRENALYLARNSVSRGGTIGSQFEVSESSMTLQKIKEDFWYVVPLDFRDEYSVWSSTRVVPGYIMISAEDEEMEPIFKSLPEGKRFRYTPNAFFSFNLERHLRMNGYLNVGLTDYTFEVDEDGNPWWVVTTYQPTIINSGNKVTGVVIVNPTTGEIKSFLLSEIPAWIDRAMPENMVKKYLEWWGEYRQGWLNSWWSKLGILEPEDPILIYGSDDTLHWVVGMTSKNEKDTSLVGLVYIDSRNGLATYYTTNGGSTDKAILDAVLNNQFVKFKSLHPADPQIYNIYGTMASVMPLLNASHAFQGVALVDVTDVQKVAVGGDMYEALNVYQEMIGSKAKAALEKNRDIDRITGIVARIHPEPQSAGTIYRILLKGVPHLFIGGKSLSRELTITEPGDEVAIEYYSSGEEEIPMYKFDNLSIVLVGTEAQKEVTQKAFERKEEQRAVTNSGTTKARINNLTPEQLQQLEKHIPPKE